VDVSDSGIEFRADTNINGIEIQVTDQASEVSGLVTGKHGELWRDCTVVIFAQDRQSWGWMSRYVGTGRPDHDGRFIVRGLPPGHYYAAAVEFLDQGDATDPAFLDRLQQQGIGFSLGDGARTVVDLKAVVSTP
jgi:hypothetical protein